MGLGVGGFSTKSCPAGAESGILYRGKRNFGDRRTSISRRKRMDNCSFAEIANLTPAAENRVLEVRIKFGKDLGDEHHIVGDVAGISVRDRHCGGLAAHPYGPRGYWVERVAREQDRHRSLGMVSHIE